MAVAEKADERRSANVSNLKAKLLEKILAHRPRTTKLVKELGKIVIDQVTIDQCIGGARDIRCLVTDISYLDPQEGIRFRGKTIPETFAALPKAPGSEYPYVEVILVLPPDRRRSDESAGCSKSSRT